MHAHMRFDDPRSTAATRWRRAPGCAGALCATSSAYRQPRGAFRPGARGPERPWARSGVPDIPSRRSGGHGQAFLRPIGASARDGDTTVSWGVLLFLPWGRGTVRMRSRTSCALWAAPSLVRVAAICYDDAYEALGRCFEPLRVIRTARTATDPQHWRATYGNVPRHDRVRIHWG